MATDAQSSSRLRFDLFEVDLRSGEVWKSGRKVRLQGQPFQVFRVLLERRGELVTREELKQALWPADTFVDFDDGLNTAVKKIRDVLGDSAEQPRYIETIPRRGYRFIGAAEISPVSQSIARAETPSLQPHGLRVSTKDPVWWKAIKPLRYAAIGVLGVAVVLVGAKLGGRGASVGEFGAPQIHSLAVLPLANLSGDREQDYFADGMTETLITDLAQMRALRVISRTSVMHYKGTKETLPQIARDLNVDAIIEGAVQHSGSRIRVTAQLIHGQTDIHLWAKTFERDSQDALVIQSELAQAIADEIKIKLSQQEQQRFANVRAVDPAAYDAYLLGNFHAEKRTLAGSDKAIRYFQEAIRIDPRYAQAYAALASAYIERDVWGRFGIGKDADQVRANALKALELDGNLAEAHAVLGWLYFQYDWDWERTEAELKRAVELNGNLPSTYSRYAFFLQTMGRHQEALAAVHRAVELDPLSPLYLSEEGRILYREREYQKALAKYRRALELDPAYLSALSRIAEAYEQMGRYDDALVEAQKYQEASGNAGVFLGMKARIYGRTGKRREAEEILKTLKKGGDDEYFYASIYSAIGDRDRAFVELEEMVKKRSSMAFVLRDPQLDSLRSDPRFQRLLRKAGLPS